MVSLIFAVASLIWQSRIHVAFEFERYMYNLSLILASAIVSLLLILLLRQVTRREEQEYARVKCEGQFAGIVELASEAVISVDTDRCIQFYSKGAEAIFGYTADEILGRSIGILLPVRFRGHHDRYIDNFLRSAKTNCSLKDHGLIYEMRKNGSEFPSEASISKLQLPDETILTIILRDVTDRVLAEDALLAAKEAAEIANQAKSQFLANMSHELRTPLNAIIGFSEMMAHQMAGPEGSARNQEYIGYITESGQHLLALITDILEMSDIETGQVEIRNEHIDVVAMIHSCVAMSSEWADIKEITVTADTDNEAIPVLCADARMIKQVLANILSNAIRFTEPNGQVVVKGWHSAASGFVIQISDTGIGIAVEDIPKALASFEQVEGHYNRKFDGTGLGLPLAKSLVELHGGSLGLQSQVGVGTTVTVRLPSERALKNAA